MYLGVRIDGAVSRLEMRQLDVNVWRSTDALIQVKKEGVKYVVEVLNDFQGEVLVGDEVLIKETDVHAGRVGFWKRGLYLPVNGVKFYRGLFPVLDLPVGNESLTVGCPWIPAKAYCTDQLLTALANLRVPEDTEFYFVNNKIGKDKRSGALTVHELCRKRAVENGSDYLLIVEADNPPLVDAYVRLRHLIFNYGADVSLLGYTWHVFNENGKVMAWRGKYPSSIECFGFKDFLAGNYPLEVSGGGLGCCLIPREIFKEVPFRLRPGFGWATDGNFGYDLKLRGCKILCDNRVLIPHYCCVWCLREYLGKEPVEKLNFQREAERILCHR